VKRKEIEELLPKALKFKDQLIAQLKFDEAVIVRDLMWTARRYIKKPKPRKA